MHGGKAPENFRLVEEVCFISLPWIPFFRKPKLSLFISQGWCEKWRSDSSTVTTDKVKYWLIRLPLETELTDTCAKKHTSWCKVQEIFWEGYIVLTLKSSHITYNFINLSTDSGCISLFFSRYWTSSVCSVSQVLRYSDSRLINENNFLLSRHWIKPHQT